jgi:hypothetical protein
MHRVIGCAVDVRDFSLQFRRDGFVALYSVGEEECLGVPLVE